MNLLQFLKENKIKLIVRRGIDNPKLFSCEMLNGFIKREFYYINTYGYGNSEEEAIGNFIELISEETIIMNIDNHDKKTIIHVPMLENPYMKTTIIDMMSKTDTLKDKIPFMLHWRPV